MPLVSIPNPDLATGFDNRPKWEVSDYRRHGFHNLHEMARYTISLRAPGVLPLRKEIDWTIGDRADVARFLKMSHFSAFAVVRGDRILYEAYAPDFGANRTHSIHSSTKAIVNLMLGQAVAEGFVDLNERVSTYLPEIGTGYAGATVKDVANMNVANNFTEDLADPDTMWYSMESAIGFRLPPEGQKEGTSRSFLCGITSDDLTNRTEHSLYKSANSEVLGWIIERTSGRDLRDWLIDIVEAAGIEGSFHITCDREGVPLLNGGACLTARDLARFGLLFARGGEGVDGLRVGDPAFIEETRLDQAAPSHPAPGSDMRYSRHMSTDGTFLGHGGWGGQYLLVNPDTDTAVVYFSVLENRSAWASDFTAPLIRMLAAVAAE